MKLHELESVEEISLEPGIKKTHLYKAGTADAVFNDLKKEGKITGQVSFAPDRNFTLFMYETSSHKEFFLVDKENNRVAVYMRLVRFGGFAYSVSRIKARRTYQGRGLGIKLYKFIIKNLGITLISDKIQSLGGARMWSELYKTPGITVYGYNPGARNKEDKFFHVEPDEVGNIESLVGKNVYGIELGWSSIERTPRLIATAK